MVQNALQIVRHVLFEEENVARSGEELKCATDGPKHQHGHCETQICSLFVVCHNTIGTS